MKKIFILAVLTMFAFHKAGAQMPRNEIDGGVGILSTSAIVDSFSKILSTAITGGVYTDDGSFSVATYLGYKYRPKERATIGLTYAYSYGRSDGFIDGQKVGHFNDNYHAFAAELEYSWFLRNKLALYSTIGAGISLWHQKYIPDEGETTSDSHVNFDFQLSPIGIKYGYYYGVFAEAGFGYKGIVSAGVFGRF